MIRARHWMVALGVALGVHLITLGLVLARDSDEGARAPGEQGIEIDLGMLGDLAAATRDQPVAATEQPPETAVTEPTPAKPQPDAAEPQTQPAAIPESESIPDIEPAAEPEPSPAKQVPQVQVKPRVSATPKPPQTSPKPPQPSPAAPQPSPAAPQTKTTQAAPASPGTETGKDSNDSRRMTTGSQNALSAGGKPGAEQSYYALIAARLAQHKRYPLRARRKGEEGTARLFFILDRQGAIVEYRLTESSGHKTLDRAVIDMLKSAAPLPAFPADMKMATLNLHIPVAFSIN